MSAAAKHRPMPWAFDGGRIVASDEMVVADPATAECGTLIIRMANAHEALVEALIAAREQHIEWPEKLWDKINAALALAEGK